jgi:hypothetical protein
MQMTSIYLVLKCQSHTAMTNEHHGPEALHQHIIKLIFFQLFLYYIGNGFNHQTRLPTVLPFYIET